MLKSSKFEEKLYEEKRTDKWELVLQNWPRIITKNRNSIKSDVRAGVPDLIRGCVWQHLSGSYFRSEKEDFSGYSYLDGENNEYENVIINDIQRTFPKHPFFSHSSFGQNSLYNVLIAFANKNKDIGYCQGMGFISAVFLTYMDEESSFWMLDCLIKKHKLKGYFTQTMPDLNVAFYKLQILMKRFLPKLHFHFIEHHVRPSMYASQWFLTLFAVNFSFDVLARIWDIYLLDGEKTIYRFAIAILFKYENALLTDDFDDLMNVMKGMYKVTDIDQLVKDAFQFKITNAVLQSYHLQYYDNLDEETKELLMI